MSSKTSRPISTVSASTYNTGTCNTAAETQTSVCTDTDLNDLFSVSIVEVPEQ